MIWAKVVDNEIMQLHDEDPSGLWHPDALEHWQQVPDFAFIGWKFKNNNWISGAQWMEEFRAEHPLPPVGPPSAGIMNNVKDTDDTGVIELVAQLAGEYTSFEWNVNGTTYNTEIVSVTIDKVEGPIAIPVSLTVTGPGGTHTKTLEGDESVVIRPKTRALPPLR